MKNVLVIYYSQTGQAKQALNAVLKPFEESKNHHLTYLLIKPKKRFPFPWTYTQFFDVFPETVQGIPCELEPLKIDTNINYDLAVIAYQPWFLSICVPINSFLQTSDAKILLAGKHVITIINCRNMWLGAQEKMKKRLLDIKANLAGNITFVDRSSNLVSLVTVLAFVLKGTKENFMGVFPKYGVTDKDLEHAPVFGKIIMDNLENNNIHNIQPQLNQEGALDIRGNLLLMEGRGKALFPLYANYISKKGTQGSEQRKTRVRIFGIVLPTAILILSPIITILSRLLPLLAKKKFAKEIAYYSQNTLRES
ncbi:MAG: dialkylresorcinol condensing enzyme DarA [Burkholderiales bacterium]|nr:dialkylresorcinol condensing enzyme DarA [Bacteroidia bacterium]